MESESKTSKVKQRLLHSDWLTFWENVKERDRLTVFTGLVCLIVGGLAFGYIGTKRVVYASAFYDVIFRINFLEGIGPGTKVRYQGALAVGEIKFIESRFDHHRIHARLKKDFRIPKTGSRIDIQTWGYFGGKFINVAIVDPAAQNETYDSKELIPIEPVTNSTIIMNQYYEIMKKEDKNRLSPLEEKVRAVQKMAKRLNKSPYARPAFMRKVVRKVTSQSSQYFEAINDVSHTSYNAMNDFNNLAENTVGSLRKRLPVLRKKVLRVEKLFRYDPAGAGSFVRRFWHEETTYDEALELAVQLNQQLSEWRDNPYRIVFPD